MIDFSQLFLLGVLSSTLHWLIARAEITRPLWSRTTGFVDKLLRCPSCSGFWISGALTLAGIEPVAGPWWMCAPVNAVLGTFLTPVFQAVHLWALKRVSMPPGDTDTTAVHDNNTNTNTDDDYDHGEQITPPDLPSTRRRSES